jgi:competence protein ComEC
LKFWALLIVGAVSPFLFVSTLPSTVAFVFLLLIAVGALKPGTKPALRMLWLAPGFFLATTLLINERIAQRLPLSENKSIHTISGIIGSLPDTRGDVTRFLFLPDVVSEPIPSKIRVYWYKERGRAKGEESNVPELHAGERWRLLLELRSPRGRINFHGVDTERWYFAQGIGARANVRSGENIRLAGPVWYNLQHLRESVLDKLTEEASGIPAFQVIVALAIADRRGLLPHDKGVLSATGTGHLLAISGLHIGLAAALGFYLGRLGVLFLTFGFKQRFAVVLPWLTAWLAALAYSGLASFGVSTQRALIMLTVATVVLLSRRNVHPVLAWMIAMTLVLVADPFAPLRAGFWFSFVAVAVLMMIFVPRQGQMPVWRKMLYAQLAISLVMAPLGMYWFQQASLPGLLANLVAIPVVSMVIVPLILAALVVLWLPGPLAGWLLTMAGYTAHWLFLMLESLSGIQPVVFASTRIPGLVATLLAMLGATIVLLPRGVRGRYAGLLMMLPMMLPSANPLGRAETQIDFLDIGQGLAVLLTARDYLMVYDTGPGNGLAGDAGWDMVAGTIQPAIKATGRTPDLIVASNADLDHAGGLKRLQLAYPNSQYLASLPSARNGIRPCQTPDEWATENLTFRVLHPSPGLPYLGNDSSCVISVNGPGLSLLLSGDIGRNVEQRLVYNGLESHTILTAPHHGSSTSSSQVLIDTLRPSLVLISAGSDNRFGFPRADVLRRYSKAHIPTLNTAQCGGLRITTDANGGFRVESARVSRQAIWRWPAIEECP